MIIAIPTEKESMNEQICPVFGRAPYFLICDTEKNTKKYIVNEAAKAQGGAGIQAAQIIIDNKVTDLIAPRLGKNAADLLNSSKIKLYKANDKTIEENVKDCENSKLNDLVEVHAGFHNHGE